MNQDETSLVVDAIAGRRANRSGKVRANCPFCITVVDKEDRKQCLQLNVESGWWKCYRCESFGRLGESDLPFNTQTIVRKKADEPDEPAVNMPEGFVPLWLPEARSSPSTRLAFKYLRRDRVGVTDEVIERARIGCCIRGRYAGRVVVPIYRGGKLVGYMTRAWKKKHPRPYLYSDDLKRAGLLYNEAALYATTNYPAIIVEGIFDTFPFWREGRPLCDGVAVLGKPSDEQFQLMINARRPLLVVFDGDAWREADALSMHLTRRGVLSATLKLAPGVDPDECVDDVIDAAKKLSLRAKAIRSAQGE